MLIIEKKGYNIIMKKHHLSCIFTLLILFCFSIYPTLGEENQVKTEKLYYAIEMDGKRCGYSEVDISRKIENGKDIILLDENMFMRLTVSENQINMKVKQTYRINPLNNKVFYYNNEINQDTTKISYTVYIDGDTAKYTSTTSDEKKITQLPKDAIIENTRIFPHLITDFVKNKNENKSYQIYEVRENEVQEATYTKIGTDNLELVGKIYNAIILDKLNKKNGLKTKLWINTENGYILKSSVQNMSVYLTDGNIVKEFKIDELEKVDPNKYKEYPGEYANIENKDIFKVLVKNGSLAIDVPNRIVVPLNDPNEAGLWYSKLSKNLYFTFKKNKTGKVTEMIVHEVASMINQSDPKKIGDDVPEKFKQYIGDYLFVAMQVEYSVLYKYGSLAYIDPFSKKTVKLQLPDDKGRWKDEFNKNTITFDLDDKGNVKSMNVDGATIFVKKKGSLK